jgi:hypothetical protein
MNHAIPRKLGTFYRTTVVQTPSHRPSSAADLLVRDDVFATAKAMKAKGVEFALEPKTEVWWTMAIFREVDGKQFVLSNKLG